jgi:hypothetical protein
MKKGQARVDVTKWSQRSWKKCEYGSSRSVKIVLSLTSPQPGHLPNPFKK